MNKKKSLNHIDQAILVLNNEQIIAYPTEAVFGFGCDPDSKAAVLRLLTLKKRPIEKGLILIAAQYKQLKPYIDDSILTKKRLKEIFSVWPGPVTFIFPASLTTPRWLTGQFNSIAVRITNHPTVIELCKAFNKPLVSTSANLAGSISCRTVNEVREQFGNEFPIVIGETSKCQNPSEIRDALTNKCFRQG